MAYDKVLRFPDVKAFIFFASGFIIGCFAPNYIYDFLKSSNDFITQKIQGILPSDDGGSMTRGIEEGSPVVFIIIAMVAGLLAFIKKMFTFLWGILFGYLIRTIILFFEINKSIEFIGNLVS